MEVSDGLELYATMRRIRTFEETAVSFAQDGLVPGFTHTCIGQEAVAAGISAALEERDRVGTTHRGHGHILARGADPFAMLAEILGKEAGCLRGMGGELHIVDPARNIIGANGIVGAGIPIATGAALADQLAGSDAVTVAYFGEGAANEGVFGESLNLASAWSLPVVFVCENNRYSEFTPSADVCAGRVADRAAGYAVAGTVVDGQDARAVRAAAQQVVARVRSGAGPALIEAETYRFQGHFYGEEALLGGRRYRDPEEVRRWMAERDPLALERERLLSEGAATEEMLAAIDVAAREEMAAAAERAKQAPPPPDDQALAFVFAGAQA
ncbi:MAG: thiamine pyrophosphate-dependent dehydrogenase E1 component subunit alpha [Solirubrobacteraceae bacterium]